MKTSAFSIAIAALVGLGFLAHGQSSQDATTKPSAEEGIAAPPAVVAPAVPVRNAEKEPAAQAPPVPLSEGGVAAAAPTDTGSPAAPAKPVADGEAGLRLNFRGAPLDMVLDYLSEAAGFTIVLETEVRGKLDVWSNQPLTKEEAVELLNQVLNKNGYAALRVGRTLTILSRDEAKKRDIPVRSGADPTEIPKSEEIVTQIIPVRFINAVQLTRDLQPLFPNSATIAANEGGNAVVVTDTQSNIRRIAEIIQALDTGVAAVSAVKVFPLQFADAKALATTIKDLFQSPDSTGRNGNQQQQQQFRGFRGGNNAFPGAGGFDQGGNGGAGGQGGQGSGGGRVATPRVVAVADERSNSLVVSAPQEQMPVIEDLVKQVDTNVDDITELRVFHLKYADPQEMAELIQGLFPDPTSTQNNTRGGQVRFGGGAFFAGGGGAFGAAGGRGGAANAQTSDRSQKESRVVAVADPRTGSIVVTAARNLLDQIAGMIQQLDSDPAKKQKVFVFSVENTDPQAVEDILKGMFETQSTRNRTTTTRSNTRQTGNQLNSRATTMQQNQNRSTAFGNGSTTFGGGTGP